MCFASLIFVGTTSKMIEKVHSLLNVKSLRLGIAAPHTDSLEIHQLTVGCWMFDAFLRFGCELVLKL